MSIEAICTGDMLAILRGAATPGAMGGVSRTFAAVGSFDCLVQTGDADEIRKYAARGMILTHQVYCSANPGVTEADRLRWTKRAGVSTGGAAPELRVLGIYSEGRPGTELLWVIDCEKVSTRSET